MNVGRYVCMEACVRMYLCQRICAYTVWSAKPWTPGSLKSVVGEGGVSLDPRLRET